MFIGIDIGTTSVKSVLVDEAGRLIGSASQALSVSRPQPAERGRYIFRRRPRCNLTSRGASAGGRRTRPAPKDEKGAMCPPATLNPPEAPISSSSKLRLRLGRSLRDARLLIAL